MQLEIRVPISPTPAFFRQVEYLWRSVRACEGITAKAKLVVIAGDDCEPYDLESLNPWSRGQVDWRWIDRKDFVRDGYHATGRYRFAVESDADVILLADADIVLNNNVDDVLEALAKNAVVAGVIAPLPPFWALGVKMTWREIFERIDLPFPRDVFQHPGWDVMFHASEHRFCPAYYNMGAVFIPGAWMHELCRSYTRWLEIARQLDLGYFRGQLALTFAIYELDLPRTALELKYNYPNDPAFDAKYFSDAQDIRILHYLRTSVIDRAKVFLTQQDVRELLDRRDLSGPNEVFRLLIQRLSPDVQQGAAC